MAVQPLARLAPAGLGTITEGEKCFLAAEGRAIAGDLDDLIRGQERGREPTRNCHEGAVGAAVSAQPRQRDEDLPRVGDDAWPACRSQPGVPYPRSVPCKRGQILAARLQEYGGLGLIERLAVPGPGQCAPDGAGARHEIGRRWPHAVGPPLACGVVPVAVLVGADGTTSFAHRASCLCLTLTRLPAAG